MKVKTAKEVTDALFRRPRRQPLQVQVGAGLQVEGFQLVLGEVADGQVLAADAFPRPQGVLAAQGVDQGGLARAVRPQQPDATARQQRQVDLVQHQRLAMADLTVADGQQGIGGFPRRRELEAERRIDVGRSYALHSLQSLEPALGLTGLGGLGFEAVNEALDLGDAGLLAFIAGLLLSQPLAPLALKGRIIAGVRHQFVLFEVHHMRGDTIHEIPVVGNEQQGARVTGQPILQPQTGIQIQVVGGLVQQQQIRRPHQRLGQVQADAPATGKGRNRTIRVAVGEAEPPQQRLRPARRRPGLAYIQLTVDARHPGVIARRFRLSQRLLQAPKVRIAIEDIIPGAPVRGRHLLGHVGNPAAARQRHLPLLRRQLPQNQLEQTGLPGAIGADQGYPLAGLHREVGGF